MSDLNKKLDRLQALIQEEDFLTGKGLSNEVNIWICHYDPKEEMAVRDFMRRLTTNKSLKCRVVEKNLYKIFLSICEDLGIIDDIEDMEKNYGSKYLLEQLRLSIGRQEFIAKIQYEPHERGDVLIITGVGDVFPFMRVHSLLEAMQKHFSDIPILVLYPGTYNGRGLKLFDKLPQNDYYRAFNVV